ncbi:MAG: DUF4126 domain-containing protein [Burkholderiales bacterium]|jgi:hypothetical protein|nr:MAG: DUF4126 domain-containing protein [Burkholderiales bacterium]
MTDSLDTAQLIAIASVLGFASGIRLYLVLFAVGLAGYMQWAELPAGLQLLAQPWVLGASGLMMAVEFFADKVPALDSLWDTVHTLIRIPAGAALAAAIFGADSATWATVAALLGGSLAATSHFTKAGSRALINTSPEPFSNVVASSAEDVLAGGLLLLVLAYPWVAAAIVLLLVLLALWLLPKLFRFVVRLLRRLTGGEPATEQGR